MSLPVVIDDLALPPVLDVRNRRPLTSEQQAKVAEAFATKTEEAKAKLDLEAEHKALKKAKVKGRIATLLATKSGETAKMPLVGKEALAAIKESTMKTGPREEKLRAMRAGTSAGASAAAKSAPTKSAKPKESTMDASTTETTTTAKKPKAPAKPKAVKPKVAKKAKAKTPAAKPRKPAARAKGAAREKTDGVRQGTKLALVVDLLKRTEGCTTAEVLAATGWPSVSMPQQAQAAGLTLRKEKQKGEPTRYWAT